MKKIICSIYCIAFITFTIIGCSNSNDSITYIPYEKIPADYSLDDAKKDKCVVFEDSKLTAGEEEWEAFIEKADSGKKAFIRIAQYSTLDNQNISEELYNEIKEDYPVLYLSDLSYDGKNYITYTKENGEEYKGEYPFLMHYTGDLPSGAVSKEYEYYILTHDESLSMEEIQHSLFSSSLDDYIDVKIVYQTFE